MVILVERYSQTTESTKARMNIYIDNKRVFSQKHIMQDFSPFDNEYTPYTFILERPGPDTIAGNIGLRIPDGRYFTSWHAHTKTIGICNQNTLHLHNTFVGKARGIFIRNGSNFTITPKDSMGSLLMTKEEYEEYEENAIMPNTILHADSNKKQDSKDSTRTTKKTETLLGSIHANLFSNTSQSHFVSEKIAEYIEIQVINTFKEKQEERAEEITQSNETNQNTIRIECEDGSDEFIEIVLPHNDNANRVDSHDDINDNELNTILNEAKDFLYELSPLSSIQSAYENLSASEYKKALLEAITILPLAKALKAKKIIDKIDKVIDTIKAKRRVRLKPKSLSREEVLEIIKKMPRGSSYDIRLVGSKKELDELWRKLTKNATKIEEKVIAITNKKTRVTTNEQLIRYHLDDGTQIIYRTGSRSGGETINIYGKNPKINKTIHIKQKGKNDKN